MPLDPDKARALAFPPVTVTVERGRLRFFAQVVGETDPVYVDPAAARAAGHPDLPVPPTFFFSLEMESPDPWSYVAELGVDLRRVLHGGQEFNYHAMVYAGDTVELRPRIVDVYTKKAGALEFLVKRTDVLRDGHLVAEATAVIVVRNPEVAG
ncbi:MaoC family dehydratase N-terminal domain-containing protein [Micromonospora sp. MS34]|uniref:MaoC family dehydratase N-terminal domain-containing protein n=1 Tax=Micromonospora sp. MS34 TaxID=3385971 RepID=UPI0039A1E6F8